MTAILVKCRQCGGDLNAEARCPSCETRRERPADDAGFIKAIIAGALVVIGIIAVGVVLSRQSPPASPPAPASSTPPARRQHVEADFYWDAETKPYRQQLVAAVEATWPKVAGCAEIDPGTLAYSPSRTASFGKGPTFFVTCRNAGGVSFNYWFTLEGEILGRQQPK